MVKQNILKQTFDYDSKLFDNRKPFQVLQYNFLVKDQALQLLFLQYKISFTHTIQQSSEIQALVPWNVYEKQKP